MRGKNHSNGNRYYHALRKCVIVNNPGFNDMVDVEDNPVLNSLEEGEKRRLDKNGTSI